MSRVTSPARWLGRATLDLLFPPRCVGCERAGSFLCERCVDNMTPAVGTRCPRCWQPGEFDAVCRDCRLMPPAFDGLRSAFVYEGPARHVVHALKYRGMTAVAEPAAALLASAARRFALGADIVVPVPLAGLRRRVRGYNQAESLARGLGRELDLPVRPRALVRTRQTPSQARAADANMRRANVAGAFACRDESAGGMRVLLIDDVTTTGATLNECAAALRAGGASAVWALTFARED